MIRSLQVMAALVGGLFLALTAPTAFGENTQHGDLTITDARTFPAMPNRPGAAYLSIANDGETDDRLISATSPMFERIELHDVKQEGDVMQMFQIEAVDVPAGGMAMLEPGGKHMMLFGASQMLTIGDEVPMTLVFERAGSVEITVTVEKRTSGNGSHGGHGTSGD